MIFGIFSLYLPTLELKKLTFKKLFQNSIKDFLWSPTGHKQILKNIPVYM